MCIRDSDEVAADPRILDVGGPVLVLEADGLPLPRAGGALSVSFTHLPAHQTGLELVFRLLPEKKKKQHKTVHVT